MGVVGVFSVTRRRDGPVVGIAIDKLCVGGNRGASGCETSIVASHRASAPLGDGRAAVLAGDGDDPPLFIEVRAPVCCSIMQDNE